MTGHTLARAVRSLYYRQHLAETIPTIEEVIRTELVSRQLTTARVGEFLVRLTAGSLSIEPTAGVHPGQLALPGYVRQSHPNDAPTKVSHPRR